MRVFSWFARAGLILAFAATALAQSPETPATLIVTLKARAMQPGELVVATFKTNIPVDKLHVSAFGHDASAFRDDSLTWRVLIGIDLDAKPGKYAISSEARAGATSVRSTRDITVVAHAFPTRQLTVDDAYVNPPAEVTDRITREAEELTKLWTESAKERLWNGPFERPVPQEANSAFGSRSVFNGQPRSPHSGADFLSPAGTPIHAPNAGRVVLARELYFSGNTVIIDHGLGLFSLFAHLSKIVVQEGQNITTDQLLGQVGATGRVTGPHLHWAIRLDGARIDPLSLLATLGKPPVPAK